MSFESAQNSIAKKEGVSEKAAGAILASSTRKASQKAVNDNHDLANVSGTKKPTNERKADDAPTPASKLHDCEGVAKHNKEAAQW
jgi:hypothetical protein